MSSNWTLALLVGTGLLWGPRAQADSCDAFFAEARTWAADNGWTVAGAGSETEVRTAQSAEDILALAVEAVDQMLLVRVGEDYTAPEDGPHLRLSGRGPFVVCGDAPWEFRSVRADDVALLAFRNVGWSTADWQYGTTGWLMGRPIAVYVRDTRLWLEDPSFVLPAYATAVLVEETPDGDSMREFLLREGSVASTPGADGPSRLVLHTCTEPGGAACGLDARVSLQGVEWPEVDQGTLYDAMAVGQGTPTADLSSAELTLEDIDLHGIESQLTGAATVQAIGAVTVRRSRFSSLRDGGFFSAGSVRLLEGTVVSDFVGSVMVSGSPVVVEDSVLANASGFVSLLRSPEAVSVSGSLLCGLESTSGGSALMRWGDPAAATNADSAGELVSSLLLHTTVDTLAEAPGGSLLAANLTMGSLRGISDAQPLVLAVDLPTSLDEALFEEWRNVLFLDTDAQKVTPEWGGAIHSTLRYWDSSLATGCSELGLPVDSCENLDEPPRFTSNRLPATAADCEALVEAAVPLLRQAPGPLSRAQLGTLPVLSPDQPELVDAGSPWEGTAALSGCEGEASLDIGVSGGSCAPWFLDPALVPDGGSAGQDSGIGPDSGAAASGAYVVARGCRWAGAVVLLFPLGLLRRRDQRCS